MGHIVNKMDLVFPNRISPFPSYHKKKNKNETLKKPNDSGSIGLGFDISCGKIEPCINIGIGMGIGLDGHMTINPF